jgi:EAL domain-containing protein (putative c-di-GMP-specific phosphodiesterase class I)
MGHRYLQGYVFARPLEAVQLAAGAWDVPRERPDAVAATTGAAAAEAPAMPS